MLLWIAVGDAAAAATEYVDASKHLEVILEAIRLTGYAQNPEHRDLVPGRYTDDAQMSIAVTETLLAPGVLTPRSFADSFVHAFKRDPRAGYARGFQAFLENVRDTDDFLENIRTDSAKNGGCMRAVPIGILPIPEEVVEIAEMQASVTHNTPEGKFASVAVALMSHFALYHEDDFDTMHHFLSRYLEEDIAEFVPDLLRPRKDPVIQPAHHTVHAVFYLLRNYHSLADVLRGAILIGGDTDSVGAIALGIASARMENDIPHVLIDKLEPDSRYGVGFLRNLGFQLMEAYDPA